MTCLYVKNNILVGLQPVFVPGPSNIKSALKVISWRNNLTNNCHVQVALPICFCGGNKKTQNESILGKIEHGIFQKGNLNT